MPITREFVIQVPCPIDGLLMLSSSSPNRGDIDRDQAKHIHLGEKTGLVCANGHEWKTDDIVLMRVR